MPLRDGTGPEGKGPKTGRGKGPCEGPECNTDDTKKTDKPQYKSGYRQ